MEEPQPDSPLSPPAPAPPAAGVQLTGRELTFAFGKARVLSGVSCRFTPGSCTAIVGPNGCGKSTLLHVLAGVLSPQSGVVEIDGKPLAAMPARRRSRLVALAPQQGAVAFGYSVRQMVLMGQYALGRQINRDMPPAGAMPAGRQTLGAMVPVLDSAPALAAAEQAMQLLDVQHLAGRNVQTLSGGERQRVVIARTLAQQAPVLLLDEPTAALDIYHQLALLELLKTMAARRYTVVAVLHDLNAAWQWADQVLLMRAGEVAATGTCREVLTPDLLEQVYRVRARLRDDHISFYR